MNPFKYRPEQGGEDPDVVDMEWADNWLSNFMAWTSQQWPFEPACNTDAHWSSKVMDYFWTDCPCCLMWRGIIIGIFVEMFVILIILLIYLLTIA